MARIIDLRKAGEAKKKQQEEERQRELENEPEPKPNPFRKRQGVATKTSTALGAAPTTALLDAPLSLPSPSTAVFKWQAPLIHNPENTTAASITIIALVVIGVLIAYFMHNPLTAIVLFLAAFTLWLQRGIRSKPSTVAVSALGVGVDDRMYYWRDLESFWIEYEPGGMKELSIAERRWYLPYLRVPLGNQNPVQIRAFMLEFLPEQEHELSIVDLIARRIGL